LAIVKTKNKYGVIQKDGSMVIELKVDQIKDFDDGLAITKQNGKYGIIDANGEWVIKPKYKDIELVTMCNK
jgi:hypothetical protein